MNMLKELPKSKEDLILENQYVSLIECVIKINCLYGLKSDLEFFVGGVTLPYFLKFKNKRYINPLIYEKLSDDVKRFVKEEYRYTTCVFKKGFR